MKLHELGALEKKIMDIVWENHSASARDVMDYLKKPLAYTTVATVLDRLHAKGLLNRKKEEKGYIYQAKVTKDTYGQKVISTFLHSFLKTFGDSAVVSFAESIDKLPKDKRDALLKMLKEGV